jgi:hypothetical protein
MGGFFDVQHIWQKHKKGTQRRFYVKTISDTMDTDGLNNYLAIKGIKQKSHENHKTRPWPC